MIKYFLIAEASRFLRHSTDMHGPLLMGILVKANIKLLLSQKLRTLVNRLNFLHRIPTFVFIHRLRLQFQKSISWIKSYSNYSVQFTFVLRKRRGRITLFHSKTFLIQIHRKVYKHVNYTYIDYKLSLICLSKLISI